MKSHLDISVDDYTNEIFVTHLITYIQYTAGTNKGETAQGDVFNDPFRLGKVDVNYTSAKVVEAKTAVAAGGAVSGTINWTPVVPGSVEFVIGADTYRDDGEGKIFKGRTVTTQNTTDAMGNIIPAGTVINPGIEVVGGTIDYKTGAYSFTDAGLTEATAVLCNYCYNNQVIPQNDIPMVNAEIKAMPLLAKARRVAVYYSQIAAYQAKNDYGLDLGAQLAEKAVAQLSYEIDTEVCNLLIDNAASDGELVFSKTLPVGVSKAQHYEGFTEIVEIAKQKIYDKTKRFAPNYMLAASNILPILSFINGFQAAPTSSINGPYFAG